VNRFLALFAACAWVGLAVGGSATAVLVHSLKATEAHRCPAPRAITLVRCPGPHEITTQRISCMSKQAIDDCAQGALGGKE